MNFHNYGGLNMYDTYVKKIVFYVIIWIITEMPDLCWYSLKTKESIYFAYFINNYINIHGWPVY